MKKNGYRLREIGFRYATAASPQPIMSASVRGFLFEPTGPFLNRWLAQIYNGVDRATTELFAEAELAGAVDLFTEVERRSRPISEEQLSCDLARLHGQIASDIERGARPSLKGHLRFNSADHEARIEPDRDR